MGIDVDWKGGEGRVWNGDEGEVEMKREKRTFIAERSKPPIVV